MSRGHRCAEGALKERGGCTYRGSEVGFGLGWVADSRVQKVEAVECRGEEEEVEGRRWVGGRKKSRHEALLGDLQRFQLLEEDTAGEQLWDFLF